MAFETDMVMTGKELKGILAINIDKLYPRSEKGNKNKVEFLFYSCCYGFSRYLIESNSRNHCARGILY